MLPANISPSMTAPIRVPVLAALALALVLAWAAPAAAQQQRPNIVVVLTDDQTLESVRVMNNLRLGLMAEGTTFEQAVTGFPLCCPSRATYLTGQYAQNHGVKHNVPPFGGYQALDGANTLPVWLRDAGYRTIHLGRYLNGYGTQNTDITEIPPGWTDWHSMVDPSTFDLSNWQMNDDGVISNQPDAANPGEHQTDFLGRRASELIAAAAPSEQPFFLSLTTTAPHSSRPKDPDDPPKLRTPHPAPRHRDAFAGTPLPRPPSFNELNMRDKPQVVADRSRIPGYGIASIQENYQQELESLQSVDDALGRLMAALRDSGELDNTLVVYTSDNGFFHGEHRIRTEKVLPYEEGIRVPLIMRGPGVPRGERVDQLVSNVDLAPTLLEVAGATATLAQDGRSLLEVLRDPDAEYAREIVLENGNGANKIPSYRGLRNERFTFVRHETTGEQELYDLREDPFQLNSLDDDERYDRIRKLLARRLRVLEECAGRACLATRPAVRLRLRELVPRSARRKRQPQVRPVRSCLRSDLSLALYGSERKLVDRVRYLRGERSLALTRKAPFRTTVRRRTLPRRGRALIRARITTIDGRTLTRDRVVQTCDR